MFPFKRGKSKDTRLSRSVGVLFLPCVPSALFDLFLPHQIFSVKSDIWNREIHGAALSCKGQLSLKESERPADGEGASPRQVGRSVGCLLGLDDLSPEPSCSLLC